MIGDFCDVPCGIFPTYSIANYELSFPDIIVNSYVRKFIVPFLPLEFLRAAFHCNINHLPNVSPVMYLPKISHDTIVRMKSKYRVR